MLRNSECQRDSAGRFSIMSPAAHAIRRSSMSLVTSVAPRCFKHVRQEDLNAVKQLKQVRR